MKWDAVRTRLVLFLAPLVFVLFASRRERGRGQCGAGSRCTDAIVPSLKRTRSTKPGEG